MNLTAIDFAIIAGYFALIVAIGLSFARRGDTASGRLLPRRIRQLGFERRARV